MGGQNFQGVFLIHSQSCQSDFFPRLEAGFVLRSLIQVGGWVRLDPDRTGSSEVPGSTRAPGWGSGPAPGPLSVFFLENFYKNI